MAGGLASGFGWRRAQPTAGEVAWRSERPGEAAAWHGAAQRCARSGRASKERRHDDGAQLWRTLAGRTDSGVGSTVASGARRCRGAASDRVGVACGMRQWWQAVGTAAWRRYGERSGACGRLEGA